VPDDPYDLDGIASRLALILAGVQAAWGVHDDEAVRTGASELLAEIEPLQRHGRESGEPELLWYSHLPGSGGAAIWLIESSATSMLEQLSSSSPDWDQVGAASSFAESGVQQLQAAISGQTVSEEELHAALADTITIIEARLQDEDLPPDRRERLTDQLNHLRGRHPKLRSGSASFPVVRGTRGLPYVIAPHDVPSRQVWREAGFVRRMWIFTAVFSIGAILSGCSGSASPAAQRHTVTTTAVCRAFDAASSPLGHSGSVDTALVKLAVLAKDASIRSAGSVLQQDHQGTSVEGTKPFYRIGAICVAKGLTPKDWAELA
jgi:hypothetical protein